MEVLSMENLVQPGLIFLKRYLRHLNIKLLEFAYLYENVGTEDNLKGIVPDEESLDVERLAIFHVIWTPNLNNVDVSGAEQECRQGAGHHDPAISSEIK